MAVEVRSYRGWMLTVGVDLAAEFAGTAVAWLDWSNSGASLRDLVLPADDDAVVDAIIQSDKTGIDCPFGWPEEFVSFVSAHQAGTAIVPDGELDEEQAIDPLEEHRADGEEVAGQDRVRLRGQELLPRRSRPPWRRINAGPVEDLPHGAGRHPIAQAQQLALHPPVAPRRILRSQAQHQFTDLPVNRRPAPVARAGTSNAGRSAAGASAAGSPG